MEAEQKEVSTSTSLVAAAERLRAAVDDLSEQVEQVLRARRVASGDDLAAAQATIAAWAAHYASGDTLVVVERLREALLDEVQVAQVLHILDTTCSYCWNQDTSERACWCRADD